MSVSKNKAVQFVRKRRPCKLEFEVWVTSNLRI
jgi:hypothetical protein